VIYRYNASRNRYFSAKPRPAIVSGERCRMEQVAKDRTGGYGYEWTAPYTQQKLRKEKRASYSAWPLCSSPCSSRRCMKAGRFVGVARVPLSVWRSCSLSSCAITDYDIYTQMVS